MLFSLRRWRARHLLTAWLGYWVGLAAVTIGPGVAALLEATGTEGGRASASASLGNNAVTLNVVLNDATLWSGSASVLAIVLWVAGPPIALWAAWLARRPNRTEAALAERAERAALPDARPDRAEHVRTPERVERPR